MLTFLIVSAKEESNHEVEQTQPNAVSHELHYVPSMGRGCCSHHGGVCGCNAGRAVCCDGKLSPSCPC